MLTGPMRRRQSTLRDVLPAVAIFDGYNVPITEFIKECRGVQNAVLPRQLKETRDNCCNFTPKQVAEHERHSSTMY